MTLHRRRVLLGAAAALAAPGAWAQAPQPGIGRAVAGIGFVRSMPPPRTLQHLIKVRDASAITDPVLAVSDAGPLREFREYLDHRVARHPPWEQLELVNRWVNRHVKGMSDSGLYGQRDLWAPPLNTLLAGGDCEDMVLLKGWALLRVGFKGPDLYLVAGVTRAIPQPTFHAVLGVILRAENRAVVLDNLSDPVQVSAESARFDPTYAINEYAFWRVEHPKLADRPYWDQVSLDIQPKAAG